MDWKIVILALLVFAFLLILSIGYLIFLVRSNAFDPKEAFGFPKGSVRGLIAFMMVIGTIVMLLIIILQSYGMFGDVSLPVNEGFLNGLLTTWFGALLLTLKAYFDSGNTSDTTDNMRKLLDDVVVAKKDRDKDVDS